MSGVSPNNTKELSKTPGGISKSLLTPCRQIGLSRKWRKSGCSPFISPLSTQNASLEKPQVIKRKTFDENEHTEVNNEMGKEKFLSLQGSSVDSPNFCNNSNINNNDITSTPSRNTQAPRKKSKVLSLSLKCNQETETNNIDSKTLSLSNELLKVDESITNEINVVKGKSASTKCDTELKTEKDIEKKIPTKLTPEGNVAKFARTESKSNKLSLKKSSKAECESKPKLAKLISKEIESSKDSPCNLTKECIVVIQNKILKTESQSNVPEKILQESNSELDVPRETVVNVALDTLNDDDFISKPVQKKIRNLSIKKITNTSPLPVDASNNSHSSQEDMVIRTIIVKNTYNKVIKPQKAKSTGSITQKDVDDLKDRIEMKKKLLLAKAMSIETEELRGLVKKWQKGCQDALMELLDLMKKKLPDRQNMDYAEILEALKIPCELIGYDRENDCFITPDDTNVLLSAFKL